MRRTLHAATLTIAAMVGLSACAGDKLRSPAATARTETADLVRVLSNFVELEKLALEGSATRQSGVAARAKAAQARVDWIKTKWTVASAKTQVDVLKALEELSTALDYQALATASEETKQKPPDVSIDELANVAESLEKLAERPDAKTQLEGLLEYVKAVNDKLAELEDAESKK